MSSLVRKTFILIIVRSTKIDKKLQYNNRLNILQSKVEDNARLACALTCTVGLDPT